MSGGFEGVTCLNPYVKDLVLEALVTLKFEMKGELKQTSNQGAVAFLTRRLEFVEHVLEELRNTLECSVNNPETPREPR